LNGISVSLSGDNPVEDFLYSLTVKQRKKIAWVLGAVRDLPFVHREYFKKLIGTDNIWEVRILAMIHFDCSDLWTKVIS